MYRCVAIKKLVLTLRGSWRTQEKLEGSGDDVNTMLMLEIPKTIKKRVIIRKASQHSIDLAL